MNKKLIDFFPLPHPTKKVFVRHHIPAAAVAKFLGLSTAYACSLLNGFARVNPENDHKLWEFARLVEGEAEEGK